jgi:hypothetical protein
MTADLGPPIASGRTAEIYDWDLDRVLKLVQRKPWQIARYQRRAAELHVEVHSRAVSRDLRSHPQTLERNRGGKAAARLSDGIPELETMLIGEVERRL